MNLVEKTTVLLFCLLSLVINPLNSKASIDLEKIEPSNVQLEKAINVLYEVSNKGKLHVNNIYGDIEYFTWDKPMVKINVIVKVNAKDKKIGQEILKNISIDFNNSTSEVSAITNLSKGNKKIRNNSRYKIKVEYQIYGPTGFDIDFVNKYGNIALPELKTTAVLKLAYGNLYAGSNNAKMLIDMAYGDCNLSNSNQITGEIKYGKFYAKNIDHLKFDFSYSELKAERIKTFKTKSKYSHFKISKVNFIENDGGYDNWKIGSIKTLILDNNYCNITIDSLLTVANLFMNYGDLAVKHFATQTRAIKFQGNYSDIILDVTPNTNLDLIAKGRYLDIESDNLSRDHKRTENSSKHVLIQGPKSTEKLKIEMVGNYIDLEFN